jgi:hypothetical protein
MGSILSMFFFSCGFNLSDRPECSIHWLALWSCFTSDVGFTSLLLSLLECWMQDRFSTYAKIWKSICAEEIKAEEGRLTFSSPDVRWPSNTIKLYERDVYKSITEDILRNQFLCVYITGTSGIGKSFYLLYLMYALVRESIVNATTIPTIFYKTREGESFLLLPDGKVMKSTMAFPVFTREMGVPNYVLIDSVVHSVDLQYGPHIMVASNTMFFKEFQKRMTEVGSKSKKIYMDQWSEGELHCISPYHLDILDLRYDIFGGSAKNFKLSGPSLSNDNNPQYAIVESIIELLFNTRRHTVIEEDWINTKASITCAIVEQLNMVEESASQEAFSSMFYQTLTTGQRTWTTTFLKLLAGKLLDTEALTISERLQQIIGTSGMGIMFEYRGHEALLKSKTQNNATSLVKYQRPIAISFSVPNRLVLFRAISDISALSAECYGVPAAGNFPCIDSIMQPRIVFQFTTTRDHPGIEDKMSTIRAQLNEKNEKNHCLVFVVPQELLDCFPVQSGYGDIKQYVMTYPMSHGN